MCFGPSLARPPFPRPLGYKALIYFLKQNNPCSEARCSETERRVGTSGWVCRVRGCSQARTPGGSRGPPRDPAAPAGRRLLSPQIREPTWVPARGGGRRMRSPVPGGPAPCNVGFALGNPLPSGRDKGREQREKNHFPKCYLFWHAPRLSARFSPAANGSRVV